MIVVDARLLALAGSGDVEDLKRALQYAVELEQSTIPPYLFARYSLGRANRPIRNVLLSIAMDEMSHMLLAGNILKAIGGAPSFYRAEFVPNYPTHLPGSVAGDLTVHLRKFSLRQVEEVFMRIEEPEHILDFRVAVVAVPVHTIGEFYRRIRRTFEEHGDELITDTDGSTQPTTFGLGVAQDQQVINSVQKAIDALDLIVEQGEGTQEEPFIPDGDDIPDNSNLAHYYRFAELVKGRIKRNPDATPDSLPADRYIYDAADPVPFNAAEVIDFPENPKAQDFAATTPERIAMDDFNRSYTTMLKHLHQAYNANPDQLDEAIGEMRTMDELAKQLAQMGLGPSFEFVVD